MLTAKNNKNNAFHKTVPQGHQQNDKQYVNKVNLNKINVQINVNKVNVKVNVNNGILKNTSAPSFREKLHDK